MKPFTFCQSLVLLLALSAGARAETRTETFKTIGAVKLDLTIQLPDGWRAFDIHATAPVAAGGKLPTDLPLDGVDLMPFLLGEKSGPPHDQMFWRAGQQKAARIGDWKLVDTRTGAPMLFNIKEDIGEQHDLAAQSTAKELQAAYEAWAKPRPKTLRAAVGLRHASSNTTGTRMASSLPTNSRARTSSSKWTRTQTL